jgi:hypothetical protein
MSPPKKSSQPSNKKKTDVHQIEWMLKSKKLGKENYVPEYGDLSELNAAGSICMQSQCVLAARSLGL